jgi:hypothetical protein
LNAPTPTDGHRRLERLVGTWEGHETMHPSPWDPKGGPAVGRTTSRLALGGFALLSDYEQARDGRTTFTGHGVYTYDPGEDRYTLHWFDCMGSAPEVFTGGFDDDVLTLGHGGPGMHVRMTWDLRHHGTLRSKMEMSEDGEAWHTLFESEYVRR